MLRARCRQRFLWMSSMAGSGVPIMPYNSPPTTEQCVRMLSIAQRYRQGELVLPQCPQEEEALVSLLDQAGGVGRPRHVRRDVGPQELVTGDTLDSHSIDVDGVVRASRLLPEVHDELLCYSGVEEQVIFGAPCGQVLDLLPIGSLIIVTDETNHRSVVRKLDEGIRSIYRLASDLLF